MNIFGVLTLKEDIKYLDIKATVRQALEKMDVHKYSVIPIIDEQGTYVGTISEGDFLRFIKNECDFDMKIAEESRISSIERYRSYKALSINASMKQLYDLAKDQNFIPVVDDRNILIGLVTRKALLENLHANFNELKQ